jgi:hypothetical protein
MKNFKVSVCINMGAYLSINTEEGETLGNLKSLSEDELKSRIDMSDLSSQINTNHITIEDIFES